MGTVSETLLRYVVDRGSVQEALAANKYIQKALNDTKTAALTLTDAGAKLDKAIATGIRTEAVERLGDEFRQVVKETGDVEEALLRVSRRLRDIGASDAEISRVGRSIAGIQAGANDGGRSAVSSGLNRAREAAIALPGVGYQSPIVVGLRAVGVVADKTGASALQLGGFLGVAGIAIGVVAIALTKFNEGLAEAKRHLDAALTAQDNYYKAISELTTEQVRAQIEELTRIRAAQQAQLQEARSALDRAFAEAQRTLSDPFARLLDTQTGISQLREQFEQAQSAFDETDQTIARLTQGYEANAFAANDATAAIERQNALRASLAKRETDALTKEQTDRFSLLQKIEGMTEQERKTREQEVQRDIELLDAERGNLALTSEARLALGAQLAALRQELELLGMSSNTLADQLDRAAKAAQLLTDQNDALLDAQEKLGQAQDKLTDARDKYADSETQHNEKLDQIAADRRAKELDAESKRDKDLVKLRAESSTALTEKLSDIQRQSDERILQIKERSSLSLEEAIAAGDIRSARHLLAERALALKQEARQTTAAQQAAQDDARQRLKEQTQTLIERYAEQVDAAQKAAKDAYDAESKRWGDEKKLRQRSIDEALRDTTNANAAITAINQQMHQSLIAQEQAAAAARLKVFTQSGSLIAQSLSRTFDTVLSQAQSLPGRILSGLSGTLSTLLSNFTSILKPLSAPPKGYLQTPAYGNGNPAAYDFYGMTASSIQNSLGAYKYLGSTPGAASAFPTFDEGGVVTKPGLAMLNVKGERYYPPMAGRQPLSGGSMGGGGVVNITVYADDMELGDRTVKKLVREVQPYLDQQETRIVTNVGRSIRRAANGRK